MALYSTDGHNHDREETQAKDGVDCDQHGLDEFAFKDKVFIFISIVVSKISRADLPSMTPAPNLHENEQDNTDGDVCCEKYIAAPQENPSSEVQSDLGQNATNKGKERHPEAPPDGDSEVLGDIDRCIVCIIIQRYICLNISLASRLIHAIPDICNVEVAAQNCKLHKEDDVVDEDGYYAHYKSLFFSFSFLRIFLSNREILQIEIFFVIIEILSVDFLLTRVLRLYLLLFRSHFYCYKNYIII